MRNTHYFVNILDPIEQASNTVNVTTALWTTVLAHLHCVHACVYVCVERTCPFNSSGDLSDWWRKPRRLPRPPSHPRPALTAGGHVTGTRAVTRQHARGRHASLRTQSRTVPCLRTTPRAAVHLCASVQLNMQQ